MSSAENGKLAGRLVWIEEIELGLSDEALAGLVRSRYGSHPADPAEVAFRILRAGIEQAAQDWYVHTLARGVLGALGVPPEREA